MTKTCLIGHTGFVGSNILRQRQFDDCFNSKNIDQIGGKSYREIICAGVSGTKWLANKDPEEDKRQIEKLITNLAKVNAKSVILISTIDVYHDLTSRVNEDHKANELPHHAYGVHRREVEDRFSELFENLLIVRLPALFGEGLKKNPVYDILNGHYLENMHAESTYQWYYLKHLVEHLELCKKHNLKLVNFFTEPVKMKEIIKSFFSDQYEIANDGSVLSLGSKRQSSKHQVVRYDLCTKYGGIFGGSKRYIRSKAEVLADFKEFFINRREAL